MVYEKVISVNMACSNREHSWDRREDPTVPLFSFF